ncbi:MAG: XTP/dITP diphosphatase [Thermodesulfovibrionales bacterium]|nr:XTP/dITP diphosphatase [Thermodesulfovibrionales bacterium]
MEIVAATRNKKKIEEIRRILKGMPVTLLSLDDFPGCPPVEETGKSFMENAVIKARAVAGFTGKPSLADDSGLEVYALGGAPGVYSARYAGLWATDSENAAKLLREMESIPDGKRGARFACALAIAVPDGSLETFEGYVEGRIGREPKGEAGFGYDPVFYPEGHDRTFAEMSSGEKDGMSHRGRALQRLKGHLMKKTGG